MMFAQYKLYIAIVAIGIAITGAFSGGWTIRGWKYTKTYDTLVLDQQKRYTAALEASKQSYEDKVQENAQIGQKYEVRINDLLTQLKSHRVQYITKLINVPSSGTSEPTSGSSTPAAEQNATILTAEELDQLIKDAIDDGARLESLQEYTTEVCTKKD